MAGLRCDADFAQAQLCACITFYCEKNRTFSAAWPSAGTLRQVTIRTYKPRRWRVTRGQAAALATDDALLLKMPGPKLDLKELFDNRPVVMEIGFGGGAATAQMAAANPAIGILAVDVHTAGIGDLLARIRARQLTNVRVVKGDALLLAHTMLAAGALAGIRLYFPDPWPKTRHHKRRLVNLSNSALLAAHTQPNGFWHIATDWAPYTTQILAVLSASPHWEGGVIARPQERPATRFENNALRAGRPIIDLYYTRTG